MSKTINLSTDWIAGTLESYEREQREHDRRPLTEKADPLALAWVAYAIWQKFPHRRFAPFSDIEAHAHDHEMAAITRKYYRNKLAMRALKTDTEPTQFQRDLYDICNGGIMRVCHLGIIYRLPYFYVEDTERAALQEHTLVQPKVASVQVEKSTRELLRHSRIFHSRRRREIMEYWFHDTATGEAVRWPVAYDNPLRSLVDHHWQSTTQPKIHARWAFTHDRLDDFCYWTVVQPELR